MINGLGPACMVRDASRFSASSSIERPMRHVKPPVKTFMMDILSGSHGGFVPFYSGNPRQYWIIAFNGKIR
jgi:hypothetical protein